MIGDDRGRHVTSDPIDQPTVDEPANGREPALTEETVLLEDPLNTADPRVDDAVARLAELRDLPTADHVSVYEDIHSRLNDALADLGDPATPNQPYLGNG